MGCAAPVIRVSAESAAWMDEEMRAAVAGGGVVRLRLPRAVRLVLAKTAKISTAQWAERYRMVHKSALPGPWRNEVTPYLVGIMDALDHPAVRKAIVCKAPQTGVTEAAINWVDSLVDQDPADCIFLYPGREMARENVEDRIIPSLKASPRLRRHLTGNDEDLTKSRIALLPMTIYTAWAHSVASMANRPAKYIVMEEPDKYPEESSKRETSAERLIEARTTTYPDDHKIFMFSSPSVEGGPIWQALTTEAQVIFEYEVVCPFCGHRQVMRFNRERFKIPDDVRDPELVASEKLAWYVCENQECGEQWDDLARNRAVAAGRWVAKGDGRELHEYLDAVRPAKVGFHLPSWLSRFVSLSGVMASFLRGLVKKSELKDFRNKHCAEPWLEYEQERKENEILKLRDERPRSVVPGGGVVAALVAFVDTQDVGCWFSIWAIGYGLTGTMWLVRDGFVLGWDDLEQVLWTDEYRDGDGLLYPVQQTLIDSAGHRTREVYTFCQRHRGKILPTKGERTMAQPFAYSKIEYYPGADKKIPGGLLLVRVNTTLYKDDFSSRLQIGPGDPGGVVLHRDVDEAYAAQLCAEGKDENGWWQQIGSRANHQWDCGVGGLVAADVRGVRYWPKPDAAAPAETAGGTARKTERRERW